MSLSERLRRAEEARRRATGQATVSSIDQATAPAVVDLSDDDAVIDLTEPLAQPIPLFPSGPPNPDPLSPTGISYNPLRTGDASSAFGDIDPIIADRMSGTTCPRCGGQTQIDLFDQVHQTASLSCLACFHMFRVDVEMPADR